MAFPLDNMLTIKSTVNPFGGLREQRIVNDLPEGPREDGTGSQRTFIGRNSWVVSIPHLEFRGDPFPGNSNLEDSVETLWQFFQDLFYNSTSKIIKYEAFYFYDAIINDNKLTWKGDTVVSNGYLNTRGEAVTNVTGRYLGRFKESSMSRSAFVRCLTSFSLELIEVAE